MIHVAEGLNQMLCSENGWLGLGKSCGASGYGFFSSYLPSLISPFMQLEGKLGEIPATEDIKVVTSFAMQTEKAGIAEAGFDGDPAAQTSY
jgi:hypothetical protein